MHFELIGDPAYRKRRIWLFLSGGVLAGLLVLIYLVALPSKPAPPSAPVRPVSPPPEEPQTQVIEGSVEKRSSLFKSLAEKKLPLRWVDLVVSKLKPYVNFKKIKGGTYRLVTNVNGELLRFTYEVGPAEIYQIEKKPEGYIAWKEEVVLETRHEKVVGEIRSSLFDAMDAAGEQDSLTLAFAEILAWEIDFHKDVGQGDRFQLVVEKVYKGDQFIRYGLIHAVEYQKGEKRIRGIRYQNDYYNEKGISLRKAFLKSPLRFNRISSKFSHARMHPVLGGLRPHLGIDYAAPQGTPIWAVADGTVVSCGWNGGFGKQVILRHMNGYVTYYGHLSVYGPSIKKGIRVRQKQIVGYVGSTGLSTGPHLDYRVAKDGRFKNPLKEVFPAGIPIGKRESGGFEKRKDEVLTWLQGDIQYQRVAGRDQKME